MISRLILGLLLLAGAVAAQSVPEAGGGSVGVGVTGKAREDVSSGKAQSGAQQVAAPTWETQKQARKYLMAIPAPRGQIVDRNGNPLAQTRVSKNLGIVFPTPLEWKGQQVIEFTRRQAVRVQELLGRPVPFAEAAVLKHYANRGVLPFILVQDLSAEEVARVEAAQSKELILQSVYLRYYPNGGLAGHIIGYAGRAGRTPDGPVENNETLWSNAEGRDGLELSFDDQLQGKFGQYNLSFDATGKRSGEQVSIPPQPGYNVVTTLDLDLQRLCEQSLKEGCKRGALVMMDAYTGDVLAMASWPTIDPNAFIPKISEEAFRALQEDKDIPLLPRAFRSAYPPGSTFKVLVGLAGLQTGKILAEDEFSCPPVLELGKISFRNWKKKDMGSMNFADALTQSCNTWFMQAGTQIGARDIVDYAFKFGLGVRTGIPLGSEEVGLVPTDEYMMKVHKRKLAGGDVYNLSIGQGDTLVTPLQMAQLMAAVANGGTLMAARLVQQVQSIDGQVVHAYDIRARARMEIRPEVFSEVRRAMVQVVESKMGTAGRAQVDGVRVAGKTGTAQWGAKPHERTAAWFAGFAPADRPKYAFAAIYEGDVGRDEVHGGTFAAPIVGKVLREVLKPEPKKKKDAAPEVIDGVQVLRAQPVRPETR